MSSKNFYISRKQRLNRSKNAIRLMTLLFLLISIILSSIIYNPLLIDNSESQETKCKSNYYNSLNEIPKTSSGISLIEDPFTKNFEVIVDFLKNFQTDLEENISLFYRYGNWEGSIIDDRIFSLDNLLVYNTLTTREFSGLITYIYYLGLQKSKLWYDANRTAFEYGFIGSINGTNEDIIEDRRYLVDNLMPIFVLIDNEAHLSIASQASINLVEDQWKLINSSEFWDSTNIGFNQHNETSNKFLRDNLYAILANLLIHRSSGFSASIKNQAYQLANITMLKLMEKMWDSNNLGFYYQASPTWDTSTAGYKNKYLEENALGIIALLDSWLDSGMNKTSYYDNATALYQKLNEKMWNTTYGAYEYGRTNEWMSTLNSDDKKLDLKANSIMMQACLKFFELTGNLTYYNRVLELYNFFETYLYNDTLHAYMNSIGPVNDTNINFHNNLKLIEAYLYGSEIFNSTVLNIQYNTTQSLPDFIIEQHVANITCAYNFQRQIRYYNPQTSSFKTYYTIVNITNANITYIFRYPNSTIFNTKVRQIKARSVPDIQQVVNVSCVADVDGSLNMTYFNISTPDKDYFIWFTINNSVKTTPVVPGKTLVNISTVIANDSDIEVARELRATLNSFTDGGDTIFSASRDGNNVLITVLQKGICPDPGDGPGSNATNFAITVLVQGANRTATEDTLLYPITEDIPLSSSFKEYNLYNSPFTVVVYANTTWFSLATNTRGFNVISGLQNGTITFEDDFIYQGQTTNITLPIESIRNNNITLNISLQGAGIEGVNKTNINFTASETTNLFFNITADWDATPGIHILHIIFKKGDIEYLHILSAISIANALDYNNLIYKSRVVIGDDIQISLNLINFLPNNNQNFNLSFSGDYIEDTIEEIQLDKKEIKKVTYNLKTLEDIDENLIDIKISILKGNTVFQEEIITIEIVPILEIISISFPEKVPQWEYAHLIIIIQNNLDSSQDFSLFINGEQIALQIESLGPGENRIDYSFIVSYNPYDFTEKHFIIVLKDNTEEVISKHYLKAKIEISSLSLLTCYILPFLVPIGIILFYKNRNMRYNLLKR